MTSLPTRVHEGFEVHETDEGYVVHDTARGALHELNASASAVLALVDGATSSAEIGVSVQRLWALDEVPQGIVDDALDVLRGLGLVVDVAS